MSEILPKPEGPIGETPGDEVLEALRSFHDLPVDLSIELGRGKLKLRDLLRLQYNSVYTLNKAAGLNLNIYVNGILFARGEPIFQEDHVGIRINEIVGIDR